jgi:hypothetical protein
MHKQVFISIIFLLFSLFSNAQVTVLDDFTDNNYTANPVWTVVSGTNPSVTTGSLVTTISAALAMSTPFTTPCSCWTIDLKSSSSFNSNIFRYYFLLKDSNDPNNATADGYYVQYSSTAGDIWLFRLDNGVRTQIGYYNGSGALTALTALTTISICVDASGNYIVSVGGTSRITVTDNTYSPSVVQYQVIETISTGAYTWTIDNITYAPSCFNPTSAGVIANAQSFCGSFDPTTITSTSSASGQSGTLEYKWQSSIISSVSSFSDIASSNTTTYDPSSITQTTWYKRLARVTCKPDWIGAAESNVIEMTVSNAISVNGSPLNDTVYNQLGNASFGISTTFTQGVSIQWQTNVSGAWVNVSNGGYYSGATTNTLNVTNPIYSMSTYQYRAVLTNACGTVNSVPATLYVLPIFTFSNNTSAACGSWGTSSTVSECLTRTITVSGFGTLNTTTNQLTQINLSLGSSACKRDLSTYDFSLTSPSGTVYNFITNFEGVSSIPAWINIKFRDHPALERVSEFSSPANWFPYSIGYYAVATDNSFGSTFSGQAANGDWVFTMCEQDNDANNIAFNSVELVFGKKIQVNDVTGSTANDDCSAASCIGADGIVTIGTNNGYSGSDSNFPGTTTDGCSWNGANNNSAWFKFVASTTSAKITLSGITSGSGGDETQLIVFARSGGCSSGAYTVPTGGCADNETYNNASYVGAQTSGNPYLNGISGNAEFNLSGLTVDQTYYLYIDGNGGSASQFYIEIPNGCKTCNTLLPIQLTNFDYSCNTEKIKLTWLTASEINNDYFTVLGSTDAIEWIDVAKIRGSGNSTKTNFYEFDVPKQFNHLKYFKLAQNDFDGAFKYSNILFIDCELYNQISFFPNPFNDELNFNINSNIPVYYQITNILGQQVVSGFVSKDNSRVILNNLVADIYFLKINNSKTYKIIKY